MAGMMERSFSGLGASTSAPRPMVTRLNAYRIAHRRGYGTCRAVDSSCPGPVAVAAAPTYQSGWSRRRAGDIVCGGLKKETKKLAKTLKAHRKRLESLLTTHASSADAATMQLVLSEISQLQSAVNNIREAQEQLKQMKRAARASGSSSSSDSDSDTEDCSSRTSRPASRAALVVAAASVCMQLEPPALDQEQPDITQQLPPAQQYSSTGRILVCQGKACMNKGGLAVLQAASHAASGSPGIEVLPCKCLGKCKQGPAVRMRTQQPGCILLTEVDPLELPDAVDAVFSAADAAAAAAAEEQQQHVQQQLDVAISTA